MDETFRQSRKPITSPKGVSGQLPPALQEAIHRHQHELADENVPAIAANTLLNPPPVAQGNNEIPNPGGNGPRLAFTGNEKLDELLASIKEQVYKYEPVSLPSRGKFYENTQAAPPVVHIRVMTGEEESILSTPRHIKNGDAINMIFKNCCRESIKPDQLLTVDRTYLLIFLRGISYGTDYEVELRCSQCGGRFNKTVDLDGLMVNYCPDDFTTDNLSGFLPTSKFNFRYRLATGKDENLISGYRERRVRQFGADSPDDSWLYRASTLITDIEGVKEQMPLQTLISHLPINDVAFIRNTINDPPFGVETNIEVLCPLCNEAFMVDMPLETSFFFPKPKKGSGTRH